MKGVAIHPKGRFGHLGLNRPVLCSPFGIPNHPRFINAFRTGLKVWSRVPWELPRTFVHKVNIIFLIMPGCFLASPLSFSLECTVEYSRSCGTCDDVIALPTNRTCVCGFLYIQSISSKF